MSIGIPSSMDVLELQNAESQCEGSSTMKNPNRMLTCVANKMELKKFKAWLPSAQKCNHH